MSEFKFLTYIFSEDTISLITLALYLNLDNFFFAFLALSLNVMKQFIKTYKRYAF